MTKILYFEDLHVGQRFVSEPEEVTEAAIISFARDSDPQFFHLDPAAAKESMFGGLVASGWQTAARPHPGSFVSTPWRQRGRNARA